MIRSTALRLRPPTLTPGSGCSYRCHRNGPWRGLQPLRKYGPFGPNLVLIAALMSITPTQVYGQAGRLSVTSLDVATGSMQAATEVSLTGTVMDDAQTDIQVGGSTIVLTLTDDTWGATVGADNQITTFLIFGLTSAQSEATGWNAVVRGRLTSSAVDRTSATVVTITLPAFEAYAITADETITVSIPPSALVQSTTVVVATPTFTITENDP